MRGTCPTRASVSADVTITYNVLNRRLTVTNTTKRVYGSIELTKILAGGAASPANLPANTAFGGTWSCKYGTPVVASGTWTVTGSGAATLTALVGDLTQIPLGSICEATETDPSDNLFTDKSYTWLSHVVTVNNATVGTGTPASFTVTNTAQRASLKLIKNVTNTHGGSLTETAWDNLLHAGSLPVFDSQEKRFVTPGAYALSEDAVAGYIPGTTPISCTGGTLNGSTVTVPEGKDVVCTFNNVDSAPKLTLKKIVDNKNGIGSHASTEWTLSATGNGGFSQAASQNVTATSSTTGTVSVLANTTYTLGESTIVGYSPSAWSCTGGTLTDNQLKLAPGADVTCTITNTVKTHTVTLKKSWKDALSGASAALSISAGARSSVPVSSTVAGNATFVDNTNIATLVVAEGATANLSEVVTGPGSYATGLVCDPQVTLTVTNERSHSITVPTQDIVCTYSNSANSVNVTLTKHWATNSFSTDAVNLWIKSGQAYVAGLTPSTPASTPDVTITASVRVGDVVTLGEAFGSTNKGVYDETWTCSPGITAPKAGDSESAVITVPAGGFDCTVTNTPKTITVKVDKQWVNAFVGDDATLAINGTTGASNADSANETDTAVVTKVVRIGDDVLISETLADGNKGKYDATYKCGTADFSSNVSVLSPSRPQPMSPV